ncbi:M20 family metallopeptidase [Clostridium polynesiense]|uniref:M20 family metallopeptidase n=1 Tax=Clostridium polynesiense TaxID=1325933 RepID=UPI00058F19D7|nr:M20 family metallopeptidase [Clostridium polynesiense]
MKDIKGFIKSMNSTELLASLIKINTVNPPGNERELVEFILRIFKDDAVETHIIDHGSNRASLIVKVPGKSREGIAFIGHLDTVPEGQENQWTYPPFQAVVKDGYMYGRGACDMKGGLTSMIITAKYFIENDIQPEKDIYLCFTADEESGGIGITAMNNEKLLKDVKEIFICEPTGEKIGIAEKGALWLDLKAKGKQCHGSLPHKGINAVENIMEYINVLKSRIPAEETHELLGKTTVALTTFTGGVKTNIIPDSAQASLDIRTLPSCSNEGVLETAKKLAEEFKVHSKGEIQVEVVNNRPAVEISRDDTFINNILSVFRALNYKTDIMGLFYYTDASQFIPYNNVPFVILGPGDETIPHQGDENILLEAVDKMAEVYISYALKGEI